MIGAAVITFASIPALEALAEVEEDDTELSSFI
jgi:hypothetical protein